MSTLADVKAGDLVAYWKHTYGTAPEVYIYPVEKITGTKRRSIWIRGLEFDDMGRKRGKDWNAPHLTVLDDTARAHAENRRTRVALKAALAAVNPDVLTVEQRRELTGLLAAYAPAALGLLAEAEA